MTKFTYATHAKSETALLFGYKICELDWMYLGQEVLVYDRHLKKDLLLKVYQVEIEGSVYVFGANEIADDEWVFYTRMSY